jgi:intracellular sulfur oxidation DsrE/DsrF family protein
VRKIFCIIIFLTSFSYCYAVDKLPIGSSLDGLEFIKIVVDFNVSSPDMILLRLGLLEKTLNDIENNNKKYDVVVAIRGGAVDFMTKTPKYIKSEYVEAHKKVRKMILLLQSKGVNFELCAIAAGLRGVEVIDILEEIKVVRNGYLSIIGYQNRGYAYLPMD